MCSEIKGKVALVTGGANGIGLAIVKKLLKQGAQNIAILDLDQKGSDVTEQLNKEHGSGKVIFIRTDVSNRKELGDAFEKTVTSFKRLDIVVNNAGALMDCNYEKELALNCGGVVEGCLLGVKYMGKNNGGKGGIIINTSSIFSLQAFSSTPVYVGTKHFINGFTRSMGTDFYYQLTGIKIMAICPGLTVTYTELEPDKYLLQGFQGLKEHFLSGMMALPPQPPSAVGEAITTVITKGENGSFWVVEEGEVYEVKLPDRKTLRVD